MDNLNLEIDRKDHGTTRLVPETLAELAPGRVRLRIDRLALTANTVTYATTGDVLGYWDFYPSGTPGWGRVPAMGWADVVASSHPEIAVGGRYYGWYPLSRYVDILARPAIDGMRDDGPHRAAHAPIYRAFTATSLDPFYQSGEDAEDRHALLRGLFVTGFLAEDFFADNAWFGATKVLVLSASSKTAIGFANCATARGGVEVVGITSRGNLAFVSGLGCYHRALAYEDIEQMPIDADAVCIDMAGNGTILGRIHAHYGDRLQHSMAIGRSHHDTPQPAKGLAGPRPAFFFAPTQVKKRVQDWGPQGYQERIASATKRFVDGSRRWLEVRRVNGLDDAADTWRLVRDGKVSPDVGYIVRCRA
jgi:hypothetical protein